VQNALGEVIIDQRALKTDERRVQIKLSRELGGGGWSAPGGEGDDDSLRLGLRNCFFDARRDRQSITDEV